MRPWVDELDDLDVEEARAVLRVRIDLPDATRLECVCDPAHAARELAEFGRVVERLAALHGLRVDAVLAEIPARLASEVTLAEQTKGAAHGARPGQ